MGWNSCDDGYRLQAPAGRWVLGPGLALRCTRPPLTAAHRALWSQEPPGYAPPSSRPWSSPLSWDSGLVTSTWDTTEPPPPLGLASGLAPPGTTPESQWALAPSHFLDSFILLN